MYYLERKQKIGLRFDYLSSHYSIMSGSRADLLLWLNNLLKINYTKVEQCGTGGAYCQILDSIYGDVPMNRVKMDAKLEYQSLANFKVLQMSFKHHGIDKPIPMEELVRCTMRANLEFLQWIKWFWDNNHGEQEYDAVARRKGAPMDAPSTVAPITAGGARTGTGLGAGAGRTGGRTPVGGFRSGSAQSNETIHQLQAQVRELSGHMEGLEKERDFYFEKVG